LWQALQRAYKEKRELPQPPQIHERLWAPSGMEDLDAAFQYAIAKSGDDASALWKIYYGTWLLGRGDTEKGIDVLSTCRHGVAKALLARAYVLRGEHAKALASVLSIDETWLQLHPQVVIMRDQLLRKMGEDNLSIREKWLDRVNALQDEWVIERRVQLLIDQGKARAAKELLLSVPFQKIHQTYSRTNLWNQICERLQEPCLPVPASLGEDRLATFGAYREFE
jgi:hypothetical protein